MPGFRFVAADRPR